MRGMFGARRGMCVLSMSVKQFMSRVILGVAYLKQGDLVQRCLYCPVPKYRISPLHDETTADGQLHLPHRFEFGLDYYCCYSDCRWD